MSKLSTALNSSYQIDMMEISIIYFTYICEKLIIIITEK